MPIYEFYCSQCNTIYNFLSKSVNTDKVPSCPKCKSLELSRQVSVFSKVSGTREEGGDDMPPFDERAMEKAMGQLAREAERLDENDPRQAASLMRKMSDATGLKMGAAMEEALHRMEQGEDPEQIEAELGDLLEEEEPFLTEQKGQSRSGRLKPNVDETLYDL